MEKIPISFRIKLTYDIDKEDFLFNAKELQEQLNADFFLGGINIEIRDSMWQEITLIQNAMKREAFLVWEKKI